jgi:hypothetical protein
MLHWHLCIALGAALMPKAQARPQVAVAEELLYAVLCNVLLAETASELCSIQLNSTVK